MAATAKDVDALILRARLLRLSAMREAGAQLMCRNLLGRDVFKRGAPEGLPPRRRRRSTMPTVADVNLADLLFAIERVNARVDWTHPFLQDPFGD